MTRVDKITIATFESYEDTGLTFTTDQVEADVLAQIKDLGLDDEEIASLIHSKVKTVDRRRHAGQTGQLDLFTGEDASLDGLLVIGPNERIRKRHAKFEQWFAGRAIEQNVFAGQAKAEAGKVAIDAALTRIWVQHPTWTYEDVLAAYRSGLNGGGRDA